MGQRKEFYRLRIPEPIYARKEADIETLVTFRIGIKKSCILSE